MPCGILSQKDGLHSPVCWHCTWTYVYSLCIWPNLYMWKSWKGKNQEATWCIADVPPCSHPVLGVFPWKHVPISLIELINKHCQAACHTSPLWLFGYVGGFLPKIPSILHHSREHPGRGSMPDFLMQPTSGTTCGSGKQREWGSLE